MAKLLATIEVSVKDIDEVKKALQYSSDLTRAAETLLAVLKRGDNPVAAMYQLEEVLSDAP